MAGGTITFGRALKVGALIALVASACYVATWEVIYYKVTPDFADKYAAAMIDKAKKGGASETELKQSQASMEKFKAMYANPVFNVLMTFVEPLPVGLLFALIAAGTLRRKPALG